MGRKKKSARSPAKPATYDIEQVRAYARGRWPEILAAVGGFAHDVLDGNHHACPKCGGTDRFRLIDADAGAVLCNQCGRTGIGDGFAAIGWKDGRKFAEILTQVAEHLGVAPSTTQAYRSNGGGRNADPAEHLELQPWDEGTELLARYWCQHKSPITLPAILAAGGQVARYRQQYTVLALPVWGENWAEAEARPVGWCLYNITGGTLPKFHAKAADGSRKPPEQVKVKLTHGSKPGIIANRQRLSHAAPPTTVWKLEGPSDLLAFLSLPDLPCDVAAITNANGAKEHPARWMLELFRGRQALICHDADRPGQDGATGWPDERTGKQRPGWAPAAATTATTARNVQLPFPIVPDHGPDLRDYLNAGHTYADLQTLADDSQPTTPPTEPIAAEPPKADPLESFDNYHRLARLNLERYQRSTRNGMLRYWRNEWYKYDGFCYRKIDETELKAKVGQAVREEFERVAAEQFRDWDGEGEAPTIKQVTQSLVSNVLFATSQMCILSGTVELNTWTDGENKETTDRFVALRNGILNIDRLLSGHPDHLLPHSPHWFSVTCLPFDFDPKASSPTFDKFLKKNLENDKQRIDLLMEWSGYLLLPNTDYQKFMFFEGEGSNGKSVFLAAIEAMIGESNCSHVSLESFGKDFILTQTLGKLVNIASECSEMDLVAEGMLKAFASGDRMTFNRKGIPPIEAAPTARLMLSANVRPRFADKSSGLWRRMILMPWRVTIADGEKTIGMDKVGWWEQSGELPGIFNWALAGLDQLNSNSRFTKSEVCDAALSSYRSEMNPIKVFFEENYIKDETQDFMVGAQYMYEHYREWCFARNYKAFSDGAFGRELARHFKEAVKKRHWEKDQDGKPIRVAYYHGIRNLSKSDDKESEDDPVDQLQLQEF